MMPLSSGSRPVSLSDVILRTFQEQAFLQPVLAWLQPVPAWLQLVPVLLQPGLAWLHLLSQERLKVLSDPGYQCEESLELFLVRPEATEDHRPVLASAAETMRKTTLSLRQATF
jgi:hypothetical protein